MISEPGQQDSALSRLKALLLGDERARLAQHEIDLERLAARDDALADRLPELIERTRERDPERLAHALSEPVAEALGSAVERKRQLIVDLLFPVIGPGIRKAIAEAMRSLVGDLNRALEASLSGRGLRWRVESWRTGVPYPQVVLKHTLRYRIDHLFLIEAGSGLVIHRESAPELSDLDSDAVAGMLTAIQQFVRDSVGTEAATLDAASVGEHLLWVESGPRANLACFLRGVPTEALRIALRERLERIHERLDDPMQALRAGAADHGAYIASETNLARIDAEARAATESTAPRASPWPLRVIVLVALALLAAWWWRGYQWQREVATFRATLASWPGLVVQDVAGERWRGVRVRALVDPLADAPPRTIAADPPLPVAWDTRGYVSLDPPIVLRRATLALAPPAGVVLQLDGGTLRATGTAPPGWSAPARERALLVPGIAAVDFAALAAAVSPRELLERSLAPIRAMEVRFVRDTETVDGEAEVAALVAALRGAEQQARAQGLALQVRSYGSNDAAGGETINAALRDDRATWLAQRLQAALPTLDVAAATGVPTDDPHVRLDARSVRVEVALKGVP